MTDVTVASTGSDPVVVGIGESPGAVSCVAYAVNGIGTVSQFYLSAIRVNGTGGGVYVRCSSPGGTGAVVTTISGVKTTP